MEDRKPKARKRKRAMRVVICGGGGIGACTAYFLALREVEVIVVERTGVACAASGKSGGFLALDWCDGSPPAGLARRSLKLHARLAAEPSSCPAGGPPTSTAPAAGATAGSTPGGCWPAHGASLVVAVPGPGPPG